MEEMNNNMELVVTEDYCEEGGSKGLVKVVAVGAALIGGTVLFVKKGVPKVKAWNQKRKDKKAGIVTDVEVVDSEQEN